MKSRLTERQTRILYALNSLQALSRSQIQHMFDLGSKRNANRILQGLREYTHTKRIGEDVYYLNKAGAEMVGGEVTVRRNSPLEHIVMRNDIYIFYHYPHDWKAEAKTRWKEGGKEYSVVSDARFTYQGKMCFLEVDITQKMVENKRKIERYAYLFRFIQRQQLGEPVLLFYTVSQMKKRQIEAITKEYGVHCECLLKA
ncbi:replication-relaxation family protein [Geobacillus sp. Y412MC52]|uniref:replication-relaxation family protein n=1 Tax=Geobacillus sp. (strain Y412MC52) TaxID=550542 RepID=UPI00018C1A53|nr:replication-relaxation family protein [Geobacillus sp. Y412MC52]ADU95270.1 phage protein [Geobacillus sp. Y412MC52]